MCDNTVATFKKKYEAVDTKTIPLSSLNLAADDQILAVVSQQQNGNAISISGFSEITGTAQADQSGTRSAFFIKKTTGTESDVTIVGASSLTTVALSAFRGIDPINPVNIAGQSNVSGSQVDSPDITTTSNNCLIVTALGGWDQSGAWAIEPHDARFITRGTDPNCRSHLCSRAQITSGPTGTTPWKLARSDGGSVYTVALNTISGWKPAQLNSGSTRIAVYGDAGNNTDGLTFTTLGSSISTINGITVETEPVGVNDTQQYSNVVPPS